MSITKKVNKILDDGFGLVDLIVLIKNKEVININESKKLRDCGRWMKTSGTTVRVQTRLTADELANLICEETGLMKDNLEIMNAAGLYIPFT